MGGKEGILNAVFSARRNHENPEMDLVFYQRTTEELHLQRDFHPVGGKASYCLKMVSKSSSKVES